MFSSSDRTVTLVPAGQYFAGRHCTCCDENQRQPPSTFGVLVTDRAFSAAARSSTGREKSTITGMPTPTVHPPLGVTVV